MTCGDELRDEDGLAQWILRRLGGPKVCIELTQEHITDNIRDAKLWFTAHKGEIRYAKIDLNAAVNRYPLTDDMDTIVDVIFRLLPSDISTLFTPISVIDERLPYDIYANSAQIGTYSNYVQLQQYIELSRRVTNSEPDWRQEGRDLLIFPIPKDATFVMVAYTATCVDFRKISVRDFEYVRRYALALAQRDLGHVRSKYEEWPSAQGSTRMDGDKLLAEAEAAITKLDEEIIASGNPMPFMTG